MAQTVKITPASGLLEFIGNSISNKPYLQHDDNGNLTLTLQSTKKFTVAGNLKVNGKVTMAQQTLTDGASITWDFNSGANAKVTLGGARTLVISNIETGDTGIILVKQDGVGGRTLSLPGGSIIVGGGSYTASSSANATDVLGVYYDGTNYFWTIGYNTVATPLTSVGITGSDFVISNSPLTANGNIALALATVNSNVGSFGSASAVPVITVNAKGLVTAVSTTAISIPTNLDSLTDVTLTSSATGQLLQYNGSQWVNWTPNYLTGITSGQVTTALGYTPVTNARTLTINGVTYDLTANRTWTIDTVSYTSRIQHGVKAGVAINKGQAVYVTSADGTNMIVGLASNTSEATSSKTMGLLDATVALNGFANVVTEGLLSNIDTSLAGTEGDPVWLGTNGNLIFGLANKPYAPNHLVFIGIVTRKNANTGEIFVKVQNGFELDELHNVDLKTTVPVNGEILGYNGTLWVNKTIAGWLGFTPANDANVVHTTGNETIAGIKTFSGTTQATSTTTGTIVTAGGVGIAKNLYVGGDINVVGNLIIGGTTTTVNAQNLTVSDNMIYLNNGIATTITNVVGNGTSVVYTTQETHNYVIGMSVTITGVSPSAYNLSNQTITGVSANSFTISNSATGSYSSGGTARAKSNANPDLGWAAGYNDGSYAHTGLFRDATDGIFKFFKGYTPEPDASAFIDTSHASFALADLQAYNITGNTFVKSGGTSSQFLKADGSVDSNTYLTTGTAASTYQPLDADLTAIAALATTGFLKRTGANTWSLDSNTYLTSYTETDTLATVTGRGATTSTAVTFSGGASISNLLLNGAQAYSEGSLALGAMGTSEGGQLVLNKATSYTYAAHLDIWQDVFRILYGTNAATAGVGLSLNLSTRQLILPAYTATNSFTGTAAGVLAFDAAGNILTIAVPGGAVSSVNAGTGVSVNQNTGAVTVSIGQSVATTATPTFDYVITTNNGNGTNVKIGDDVWIGDINAANTLGIKGQQDSTAGYITFGSELTNKLGRTGTGALTWGGNTIYHAGNLTNLNQLTNGPGYITSYTETDTLATVTGRGATTSTASSFTGGATITGLTIAKSGTDSTITFPAQTNDPGYIKHYESNNTAIMYFNVSDDSNDYFYFGYTGNPSTFQLRSDGVVTTGTWQGSAIADSYISSAATWNAKQAALSGSGIVKSTSGTISYISGTSSQFIKGDGSLDSNTYLTTGTASSTYLTISTASSTYLPLSGGTLNGSLTINSGLGGNDTTAYGSVRRLIFDNAYSDVARGPNKITLYADAGSWAAGFGIHSSTVAYYSGDAHRWYKSTSQTSFTNIMTLDASGNLTATSFSSPGGTSTQFLKADGSIDSSTYATQTYVTNQISSLVASAPSTLDTLNELAAALGNDPNFATTISTSLGNRLRVDINTQNLTSTQKSYGRTNLGVVIGTDVQAWDADLDAIAALAGTSGYLKKTAANTWTLDTNTYITGNQTITLSGDVTGSGTTSISTTLSNTGVTAATYKSVTVDAKGRVTAGSNPTTISGFGITDAITTANIGSQSVAYATDAKWISFDDGPRDLSDRRPNWNNRSVAWDFVGAGNANGVGNYAGVMTFSPWDGTTASTGDSSYQLAFINETGVNASGVPGLRLRNGIDTTWNNWYQIWHSGNFTNNSSNWNTAYNKRPTALAFSGTSTKTLTLTLGDSSTLTASFTDTDTDAQTLSISGSTLSISGGNSITLPASGISQATADSLYVNVSGDEMTGNLYVYSTGSPAQIQLAGTNPELYVHATSGTARMFINRQASGNQATLMFTTGMNVTRGSAWDYTGVPMWSMGMTNNNNTDSFKIAYGDIYDPNSVALEITSANVAYFRSVPYAGGNLLATQAWVTSRGYITGYTETDTLATVTSRGASTSTNLSFTGTLSFGSQTRQMINLWGTQYGIGIQSSTQYFRTDGRFSWFYGGTHSDTENTPGTGGTNLMTLNSAGNLTVTGTLTASGYNKTNWDTAYSWGNHASVGYLTGITSAQVTTALGYTPYNSTNPNGYITGITSGMVTTALGYTPYNSTNPSGYITGITSGMVTTALGYTPANSSHNHTSLTGVTSIAFASEASDSSSISTTISGTSTYFDFNLTDDNNNDEWRWRFTPSGASVYNAMRLVPVSNTSANLVVSGSISASGYNDSNWNTAYNKRPTAIAFSGTSTKTLTLTLGDSSTLTATFTDTDTDAQTLSISGSTLTISGGNSITLPSGGISQGTADSLYVNVSGDTMTGALRINGSTSGQELFAVDGVNGRLFSVVDDLSDSLYSVNTIAGLPVLEVFANNVVTIGKFGTNAIYVGQDGRVGIGTTDFSYTAADQTSPTNNKLFVNGSIQLLGNNDAIVFGRGTATVLRDEKLAFGWGSGWYMEDSSYLRVVGSATIYSPYSARFDGYLYMGGASYYLYSANSGLWTNGNLGASGDLYLGTRSTWLSSWLNQSVQTGADPTFNSIYLANGNLRLYQGDGTGLRVVTAYGWMNLGAQNGSWTHMYSDKSFYFNQNLYVNGTQVVTNSGTWSISISGNAATASSVAWTNVSGRPTALSSFTNDLGNYGGFLTSETIGTGNTSGVVGAKYQINDTWLRVNSDNRQFQMYGNSRTMIYRTDGNTNDHGGGGYAHIFYYGGSADANRVVIINTDGRLWTAYHGWLDSMSVNYASSAGSVAWTNVTSRPTALSQFTNDLGNYGGWQSASTAITTSNIGSQSVNYASSAGSVAWTNVSGRPTALSQFTNDLGIGGAAVTIQDAPPAGTAGKLWWESDTGKLKVYYGSAWVDATPVPDMSLYYSKAGGSINGDVTVRQTLTVVGNTLIQGVLTETSDISLKENILPLENSLDKVMKLNGVSFNKKATPNMKEVGFIAQEVEEILPDLVTETGEGIKTVSYSRVTAVLVETIKEQQAQIDALTAMVDNLTKKLDNL